MSAARAPPVHERHRPEATVLYAIVKEHLAAFLRFAAEQYAAPLPKYVVRAFQEYLRCGLLEYGFLRVQCESCRKDRLVAFSCKKRGPCASCAARVMCNTAAHLTDRVLPNVPIRQWVLSLPFELRIAAARDPKLLAACDRALVNAVFRWMRAQLGLTHGKGGAVSFVQRFGSSINLHVHYHSLFLDGLFVRSRGGPPVFVGAPAPTASDLARVLADARAEIGRWLTKHASDVDLGLSGEAEPDALAGCAKLATQRGLFVDLGRGPARDDDDEPSAGKNRKSALLDGFNLHAAVRIGADDDVAREKLIRYCARPAFALERLSVLPDGRIAYAIKNPRKGATHRTLTPIELLARIAALIPPPRHPFLRYHLTIDQILKFAGNCPPRDAFASHEYGRCRGSWLGVRGVRAGRSRSWEPDDAARPDGVGGCDPSGGEGLRGVHDLGGGRGRVSMARKPVRAPRRPGRGARARLRDAQRRARLRLRADGWIEPDAGRRRAGEGIRTHRHT
jgi:hypothetical protein